MEKRSPSHSAGEFSFAVIQVNKSLENHNQDEARPAATFVTVYHGHVAYGLLPLIPPPDPASMPLRLPEKKAMADG